jgi:hypothetical protein
MVAAHCTSGSRWGSPCLTDGANYKLNLPRGVPAADFWPTVEKWSARPIEEGIFCHYVGKQRDNFNQ